jgi:hypothetical protein
VARRLSSRERTLVSTISVSRPIVASSACTCVPGIQIIAFGSRAARYSVSTAARGRRSSPSALTIMNGRGAMRATQRSGARRGPAMMTLATAAASQRSGAKPMVRRMFISSGAKEPPEPCSTQTRVMRWSSAPAIVTNGAPRLTPTASTRERSTSGRRSR